jgi:hypothetical protein
MHLCIKEIKKKERMGMWPLGSTHIEVELKAETMETTQIDALQLIN